MKKSLLFLLALLAWDGPLRADPAKADDVGALVLRPFAADGASGKTVGPITTDEELLSALDLSAPGMEKVRAAVESRDIEAVKAAYLDYRRKASPARWKTMPSEMPAATAKDDTEGNEVLRHRIRNVDMGEDFDWTRNPLPKSNPAYTDEWTYGDIGRMEFWNKLAVAYWKTHDEKYAAGWVALMEDFVAKNPADRKGEPSLWRTLDTGLRMSLRWPETYYHFLDSPSFTPEAEWIYLRAVCDHARRLREVLRNPTRTGNWVTTECYGLYTVGALFPELRDAAEWRQTAIDRLLVEVNRMVPPDGFEAELTPAYHYFSLKGFLGVYEIARLNRLPVPDLFREKLLSMYRALVLVMDPAGNDVTTNDSLPVDARKLAQEGLDRVGDDPLLAWAASGGKKGTAPPASIALPYAGFYAMRGGWRPNDVFLFFRAGPTGTGHEHEDMLEVVLHAWGRPLLFDAGTYGYDHSEWRRYTLGTSSHNTVVVDGLWQHRGTSKVPAPELHNPWATTPLFDYAAGTYDAGYQKNEYLDQEYYPMKWVGPVDRSVTHTRRVLFLKPYYGLVLDTLDGTGRHTFDAHFHIDAPGAAVDPATQAVAGQPADGVSLGLYPLDREHLAVDVVQGQKEPLPLLGWFANQHRAIPTARFRKEQEAPALFATFLYPYRGAAPELSSSPLEAQGEGLWAQALRTRFENVEIVVAKDSAAHPVAFHSGWAGDVEGEAALLLLRKPASGGDPCFGGREVKAYRDRTAAFASAAPLALAWIEGKDRLLLFNGEGETRALTVTAPFPREVTLPPGVWMEVSASAAAPMATAPEPFAPLP